MPVRVGLTEESQLTPYPELAMATIPCSWAWPTVCSAPSCVEKAYAEAALLASQLQFWIDREDAA
jgi:hypothetical protein